MHEMLVLLKEILSVKNSNAFKILSFEVSSGKDSEGVSLPIRDSWFNPYWDEDHVIDLF
jgi:hypothetical protein